MPLTNDAFAVQFAALLHLDAADTTSLQNLVAEWNPTTPADLANSVTNWVNAAAIRDQQYNAWATGTATGGPNGDGTYPINIFGGGTVMQPCPAKILTTVTHGADAKTGVSFSVIGPMNPNELLQVVAIPGPMTINTGGVVAYALTTPTADTTFIVQKNGAAWGTVTIKAGLHNSITESFSNGTLAVGDVITLIGPAAPDATLQNLSITLPGVAI